MDRDSIGIFIDTSHGPSHLQKFDDVLVKKYPLARLHFRQNIAEVNNSLASLMPNITKMERKKEEIGAYLVEIVYVEFR